MVGLLIGVTTVHNYKRFYIVTTLYGILQTTLLRLPT